MILFISRIISSVCIEEADMKKCLAVLLILTMLLSLASCGAGNAEESAQAGSEKSSTAERSSGTAASSASETQPEETKGLVHPYNEAISIYQAQAPRQVLVQDTGLYETMVHGRYFDLWDRRSVYFTAPELYGFETVLTNIQNDNVALAWLADHVGAKAVHQEANQDNYVRLLLMLIVMQSEGFSQAAKTLSDYDTLKSFPDYTQDFVDIGLDIVDMDAYGITGDMGISLVNMGTKTFQLTAGSLAEYEMYRDAASNYNNAYILLDTLKKNTADKELLKAVDEILPLIDEARDMIFGGNIGDYTTDVIAAGLESELFVNTLIAFMEESAATEEFAKDTLPFVKQLKDVLSLKAIPGVKEGKIIFKSILLAGDLLFDTSNTYNRYAEMKCLSGIASALRGQLSAYGYEPALEPGGIEKAKTAVPLLEFYLLTCMRGEYCAEELVLNGGGILDALLGKEDAAKDKKVEDWFAEKNDVLAEIYSDADMILCTGNEIYYRYLEYFILPEYGWAKTGSLVWDVKSLDSSANGNMADEVAKYKDNKTGETGTGVVSAIVKDFDDDGVNDMLVLLLDTAPISNTALSVVYKNASALGLKAKLYTMQYSERPEEETSGTGTPVTGTEGPLSDNNGLPGTGLSGSGIPDIRKFFREQAARWQQIHAADWRLIDRYTVVETDSIDLASEFYGLGYGFMKAGLYYLDDVLYFYTQSHMDDYTTYGPGVSRTWHVEDGRFVFDNASRRVSWGQGSFAINLGDNGRDFGPLTGDIESGILLNFTAEISRYYNKGTPQFTTVLEDRSYIRKVLEEGESVLTEKRGAEPVRRHVETIENAHKEDVKGWLNEIASQGGISMSFAGESKASTSGAYWAKASTAKGTSVTINIDQEGKITQVEVLGKYSERRGDWQAVKDAVLKWPGLKLPPAALSRFSGDCGANGREDYDWGYILLGNMDNIFIRIVWK